MSSMLLVLCALSAVAAAQLRSGNFGYQPNTATPPTDPGQYTGRAFVYSTTENPTIEAMSAAGIDFVPGGSSGTRTTTRSAGSSTRFQTQSYHQYTTTPSSFNNNNQIYADQGNSNGYNNMNSGYGSSQPNNQYGYSNPQMDYQYSPQNQQSMYNSQFQSTTPAVNYLLRDQNWNYNYNANSNDYSGQALYDPLRSQYTSAASAYSPNGYNTNWNSNYNQNQRNFANKPFMLRLRRQTSDDVLATSSPYTMGNGLSNPQFDASSNAAADELIRNPNYDYLPSSLASQYLNTYYRMYDPSSDSMQLRDTVPTETPVLSNDAQNSRNYQQIQADYVNGRDKYQMNNADVTNNIYGYNYASSSSRIN